MSKDDLARKNLDHVSFAGDNLSDSSLSHASLRHAHLEKAQLQNTDLSESDLQGAHLNHADVTGAVLRNANLAEADLRGVNLDRAASAEGATLRGAKGVPPEMADDRVINTLWNDHGDAAEVEYVARRLARASGFHGADGQQRSPSRNGNGIAGMPGRRSRPSRNTRGHRPLDADRRGVHDNGPEGIENRLDRSIA